MSHALVLNASFEPLHIVSWQRAVQLLFQGKVEVVEESDLEVRSIRFTIKVPAVLRLVKYVALTRKKDIVRFSRVNVFLRDKMTCQYCRHVFHKNFLTLDHVIPIVQGGKKSWDNIVTACKDCNQKKGGRTPSEARMKLVKRPRKPNWLPGAHLKFEVAKTPEKWKVYLQFEDSHYQAVEIRPATKRN